MAVVADVWIAPLRSRSLPDHVSGVLRHRLPDSNRQNEVVVGAAASSAGRLAMGGYTVVYEGVVGPWFLAPFVTTSGVARLHYVLLLPPEATCIERVVRCVGHGFSDFGTTRQMYREFARSAIDPRHVIETVEDPAQVASLVHDNLDAGRFLVNRT